MYVYHAFDLEIDFPNYRLLNFNYMYAIWLTYNFRLLNRCRNLSFGS